MARCERGRSHLRPEESQDRLRDSLRTFPRSRPRTSYRRQMTWCREMRYGEPQSAEGLRWHWHPRLPEEWDSGGQQSLAYDPGSIREQH